MYSSVTGVDFAVREGLWEPGNPEQAPTPRPRQNTASEAAARLRIETACRWFIIVLLRLAHPVWAVAVWRCRWGGVDGLECGADVDHQVFCSLWQFVIGDLILFYCDGDGQGAAGVRVPHTGSAPPIVSRDDQVGVPV